MGENWVEIPIFFIAAAEIAMVTRIKVERGLLATGESEHGVGHREHEATPRFEDAVDFLHDQGDFIRFDIVEQEDCDHPVKRSILERLEVGRVAGAVLDSASLFFFGRAGACDHFLGKIDAQELSCSSLFEEARAVTFSTPQIEDLEPSDGLQKVKSRGASREVR